MDPVSSVNEKRQGWFVVERKAVLFMCEPQIMLSWRERCPVVSLSSTHARLLCKDYNRSPFLFLFWRVLSAHKSFPQKGDPYR
jgi:hypothetical protein